jgi:hypothetical protein
VNQNLWFGDAMAGQPEVGVVGDAADRDRMLGDRSGDVEIRDDPVEGDLGLRWS